MAVESMHMFRGENQREREREREREIKTMK